VSGLGNRKGCPYSERQQQNALATRASAREDGNGKPASEERVRTWSEQPDPQGHALINLEIWKFGDLEMG